MTESTALVCVASESYQHYAEALMASAREFFRPTEEVELVVLPGIEGWPQGTLCRHRVLLEHMPRTRYVFLCDADCRFESPVGPEILPIGNSGLRHGITATLHPGYTTTPRAILPYETDPQSACFIKPDEGSAYYAGGFFGGGRLAMKILLAETTNLLDRDVANGITPRWHDESALNRALATIPPQLTLGPEMCHPEDDRYYRETVWREKYPRKLVALDKAPAERVGR